MPQLAFILQIVYLPALDAGKQDSLPNRRTWRVESEAGELTI
jgi:hypothetical protein